MQWNTIQCPPTTAYNPQHAALRNTQVAINIALFIIQKLLLKYDKYVNGRTHSKGALHCPENKPNKWCHTHQTSPHTQCSMVSPGTFNVIIPELLTDFYAGLEVGCYGTSLAGLKWYHHFFLTTAYRYVLMAVLLSPNAFSGLKISPTGVCGHGSSYDPAGGSLQCSPRLLSWLQGRGGMEGFQFLSEYSDFLQMSVGRAFHADGPATEHQS